MSPRSLLFSRLEQPQLSKPFLLGEVLQTPDHLCGAPLDMLEQVHVLLELGAPELDARLQVGTQQSGAEAFHKVGQAGLAFGEAMLAVSNRLPVPCVP